SRLREMRREVGEQAQLFREDERRSGERCESLARLQPLNRRDRRDGVCACAIGERTARCDRDDPCLAFQGVVEARERLLCVPGVARAEDQRVRTRPRGELVTLHHGNRNGPLCGRDRGEHVACDPASAHPAVDDAVDPVPCWQSVARARARYRFAPLLRRAFDDPKRIMRIDRSERAGVVEVVHEAGFSASSMSMMGISSRTGYTYLHVPWHVIVCAASSYTIAP